MKRFFSFFVVAAFVLLTACHSDPVPALTVSPESLSFPEGGGSQTISISANYPWTASVSGSAFSLSSTSGEGNGTLTVTAAPASSVDPVTGTLTVRSENLSASVSLSLGAKSTLVIGNAVKASRDGGAYTIDIQYNVDYEVEVETAARSWLKFIGTKALSSGKLEFEISPNDGGERSGKVTVRDPSGKAAPVSVTVIQEAENKVLAVGSAATVPAEGATLEVDVRYNVEYSVDVESSARSWLHYVETKAVTDGKLVFKVDANETPDPRVGKVTLKTSGNEVSPVTITVTQEKKIVLNVGDMNSGEPASVSAEGGSIIIPVEYNTAYSVEVEDSAKDWINIIRTKALSEGRIELYVSENSGEERTGRVTVKDDAGKLAPVVLTIVQQASDEPRVRRLLMDFYEALDGPNWKDNTNWGTDAELWTWKGVGYNRSEGLTSLYFYDNGLKGEIPESIGELTSLLSFSISHESGITGKLPDSFANLVNLSWLQLIGTSMTSLPDVFGSMSKLMDVWIDSNFEMTGPIPASIGTSDLIRVLNLPINHFTGVPPESLARHYKVLGLDGNYLSGKIPAAYLEGEDVALKLIGTGLLNQYGEGFDISDIDIPGYYPVGDIEDIISGKTFEIKDIVSRNRYTVYLSWAPWCPFSAALLPQLLDYYNIYKQDGLEIVATVMIDPASNLWEDPETQRKTILEKGYDQWYNFYFADMFGEEINPGARTYPASTPQADVIDNKGNILFSWAHYNDPRSRFGHPASTDLIPFLETLLGPAEAPDNYTSKDYSKDGQVLTLQKASVGKGIDIVFMGDAYTDRDMAAGGLYETVMKEAMEEFFAIEPYRTFRDRFNVYAVKVVSPNGRIGEGCTTALSSTFGNGTEITGDVDKCYEYSLKVPSITDTQNLLVNVIVNTRRHSGTAVMSESTMSAVTFTGSFGNDPEYFGNVLRHEAGGHGFAFLADEYVNNQATAPANFVENYNRLYREHGWFANVDFADNPEKIRWSAFLADERYKDEVGIFEGGALYSLGAYRPSFNSMMRENMEYYNAPSRWTIYKRIMDLSGEDYSFEKFLEYDAVNRGAAGAASSARVPLKAATAPQHRFVPGAPPVILP